MTYQLSKNQKNAISLFQAGYNIFITGSGGCGKSFLVNQIVKNYSGNKEDIVVTSTTGISSLNIGGKTIHSWSGMNNLTNFEDISQFVWDLKRDNTRLNNWLFTKVLIIDEVSMLSAKILDFLDHVGRKIRNTDSVFGGIQIILTGDFFQLPPVNIENGFAFQAKCWDPLVDYTIELQQNYRQNDETLVKFLGKIRKGIVNDECIKFLEMLKNNTN